MEHKKKQTHRMPNGKMMEGPKHEKTESAAERRKEYGPKTKVWETPNPKKKSTKLTPTQKTTAKARAKKAGRPYPNLVDNMAAAKKKK